MIPNVFERYLTDVIQVSRLKLFLDMAFLDCNLITHRFIQTQIYVRFPAKPIQNSKNVNKCQLRKGNLTTETQIGV